MLDTKLKNRVVRRIFTIVGILAVTVGTLLLLPGVNHSAQEILSGSEEYDEETMYSTFSDLYAGCYVLYYEILNSVNGESVIDVFTDYAWMEEWERQSDQEWSVEEVARREVNYRDFINNKLVEWSINFEELRDKIEYYAYMERVGESSNSLQAIEEILKGEELPEQTAEEFQQLYVAYFLLDFDENGRFAIAPLYNDALDAKDMVRMFGKIDREKQRIFGADEYSLTSDEIIQNDLIMPPKNLQVVVAIPNSPESEAKFGIMHRPSYSAVYNAYRESGAGGVYFGALAVLLLFMCFMTSRSVWKSNVPMKCPGIIPLFEISAIGVMTVIFAYDLFIDMIRAWEHYVTIADVIHMFGHGTYTERINYCLGAALLLLLFSMWYFCIRMLRPVFSLGILEYLKEYSLIGRGVLLLKKVWHKCRLKWSSLRMEIERMDFGENGTKTILKVVLLNFPILALIACCWVYGVFFVIIYSVVLFFLLEKYYQKIRTEYNLLLDGMRQIEGGNFDVPFAEDLGSFEPIKKELFVLQDGLKNAVEKEIKSERMKTELITNVSHDLKTPLTAITTYVELLKKDNLTEEERRSYIEILERKSFRLKVLIEDLFEVSKAASNSISLKLVDVDVVNLLKQVSVEHENRFAAADLKLRFDVPKEKVTAPLDSAKTYRIFENLFANVGKYAMEGSRVYVTVKAGRQVEISIKNISAEELCVKPEELTERFVRGDLSRNTEGSGLGLAIAKSFTEAQNGTFRLDVDGDLFKVTISFPQK